MRILVISIALASLLVSACNGVAVTAPGSSPPPLLDATPTPSPTSAADPTRPAKPATPARPAASATPAATSAPTATPAATAAPTPGASPTPREESPPISTEVAAVHLSGPFGSLEGRPGPAGSESEPSGLRALDQYAQGARLGIGLKDDLQFVRWTVTVSPIDSRSDDRPAVLSEGPMPGDRTDYIGVTGPDTGEWLLRLDAEISDSAPAAYHWRLAVPRREVPDDGVLEVPAPDLIIAAGQRSVVAELGSGCYVFTCGDSGGLTPAHDLPRIRAERRSLVMTLSDESAFVGWRMTGWPVGGDPGDERSLSRARVPEGTERQTVNLPPGDWYARIQLTFDLERGALSYYARITVD